MTATLTFHISRSHDLVGTVRVRQQEAVERFSGGPAGRTEPTEDEVLAIAYTIAADRFAHRERRGVVALRTSGHPLHTGFFQAYQSARTGGLSSIGAPFHVAAV